MKTGVIEILPDEDIEPKKGSLRASSNVPPPGDNGGGDGGSDDKSKGKYRPMKDDLERPEAETQDKSKIVTWFLLLVVLMTFGGLIGAYVVISTNNVAEWKPFNLPVPVFISTGLIIVSSFVYDIAKRAINRNDEKRTRLFLVLTTVLGAAFISSQILAWLALVNRGLYMQGNPYAGFFYILTGIHAVHVLGGIVALGAILLRSWNYTEYGPELEYRRNLARSVGWYWHFMGILWIVLFLLLGFWK
jgi:cytochrome c oxidase subunit 3